MDNEIIDVTYRFIEWFYERYGRLGCGILLLIIIASIGLVFFLLNKLPESKKSIVWSKCNSCKYKCKRKEYYYIVVTVCPAYEESHWNQFRSSKCPIENYEECKVIFNQSNPAILNREGLPKDE